MSFKPVVQILQVPRTSSSFYFKDATEDYPGSDTGWGVPNGPTAIEDITSVWGAVQGYGREPIPATDVAGTLETKAELTVRVPDGVNNFWVYYGQSVTVDWVLSTDEKTITFTSGNMDDTLEGVEMLSVGGEFPVRIASRTGNVVTLAEPIGHTATAGATIFRYWTTTQRRLVLNCAEGKINNSIAALPLKKKECESSQAVLDMILLKLSAVTAYNCGNFSRAQEAAELGCYGKVSTDSNCSTCG